MLLFLDTEFTDFAKHGLISLALVAEDGCEFYAERTDYRREDCSVFVRQEVLPPLGRVPGAACTQPELMERLHTWFERLPEPATLAFDFEGDWLLLKNAWLGTSHRQAPPNIGGKLLLARHTITHPIFEKAQTLAYTYDLPPHHALADARTLMAGYRAWEIFMEPIRRIR